MWREYNNSLAPPLRLQHRLTAAIESRLLESLLDRVPAADRARLLSLGPVRRAPNRGASSDASIAGHWLSVIPTHDDYSLSPAEFRLSVRHRLGLPPSDDMPLAICMCNKASFNEDAQHFFSCSLLKRTPMLARHNGVANIIASAAARAHFCVTHEFDARELARNLQRLPSARVADVGADDGNDSGVPDLLITGAGVSAFVDVAISYPAAPSYVARSSTEYAYVAALRAAEKHKKYDEFCREKSIEMIPFAIESTGAMHREAYDFLVRICMNESAASSALLKHSLYSLAVALQRGNAAISLKGLALLRQHAVRQPNRRVAFF
jgi:hypothetical protein